MDVAGLLRLDIIEADGIPKMDMNGKADPYVIVKFGLKSVWRSTTKRKTRSPQWNETMKLLVASVEKNYDVEIEVWDWDKASSDDFVGMSQFDLKPLFKEMDKPIDLWLPINLKEKNRGRIHIVARVMSKQVVEEEFWRAYSMHFDVNHSGCIGRTEFTSLLSAIALNFSPEQAEELYERADTEHDGELSYDEVYKIMSQNHDITSQLLKDDPNFLWKVYANVEELNDIGHFVLQKNLTLDSKDALHKDKVKTLMVHDRETGKLVEEKIPHYISVAMHLMYSTRQGKHAVNGNNVKNLLKHLSVSQGKKYDDPKSKKDIEPFIKFHGLNVDEILNPLHSYRTFNEFFYRKLKADARVIDALDNPNVAVSPADCRLNAFRTVDDATRLWIKGANFSLRNVISDDQLADKYVGGAMVIARLAPQDYHRFHVPVDGVIGESRHYDGTYYTVNPTAICEKIDVYTENKRLLTIIHSDRFGDVLFVAIGATMVGSIMLTTKEGQRVKKGDEHGYFAFGGSTVLLFFLPECIKLDMDLVVNSEKPIETLVKMGSHIGQAINDGTESN